MKLESMEHEIRIIVAAKAARDPAEIGSYEDFEEDLGLDSLDRLDLLAEVEDELGIQISEDQVSEVRNLSDLLKAVGARARERAA
jgi:acyl carrier protein